mgnify:CR=1 FL=1
MILYLINQFDLISLQNFISYLTVRTGLALFTSFSFILVFGPFLITQISKYQTHGQPIRDDGPEGHLIAKKGTPTMGGIIILISIVGSILLWVNPESFISFPIIFMLISFGISVFCIETKMEYRHPIRFEACCYHQNFAYYLVKK